MIEENEIKADILKNWTMFDSVEVSTTPGCVHIIACKSIDGIHFKTDYLLSIWEVHQARIDIIKHTGERLFLSLYENYAKSLLSKLS